MSTLKGKGCLFLASSLCDGLEDNDIKQVTTLLLNKDANPNIVIPTYGITPFHLVIGNDSEAFAEEVTKLFLRHGGNPNVRSADGLTPVHVAAAWGRVTVLELLLANGGDPLCLDDEGRSPFHYAFDGKYYKAIVVLGKYCENTAKEERATQYKITFDKLLVCSGNVMAEYTAPEISVISTENMLTENIFKGHKIGKFVDTKHKVNSFHFGDSRGINDNQFDISAAELQIREEMDKEKFLVNKIINQLSNSLKSNSKEVKVNEEHKQSEQTQYDSSPSSTLCADNSVEYDRKDKFSLKAKARKLPTTPKYRRRVFRQNNNAKIPLRPVYDPKDSIISKSPNFLINKSLPREERYLSPKVLSKESRVKAFTPCMTRNQSFRSEEFDLRKEVARSTPRRKKRLYRQYSFHRKLRKNDEFTSPENTSPDSMNSLSPDQSFLRESNYKFNKHLAIKLHEYKYDDDIPMESNKNKAYVETCALSNNLIEGLNNNFTSLKIKNKNFKERNKEDLKKYISQDKFSDDEIELRTNSTVNTFKENLNTLLSSFKSQSCISIQEEYKYENVDEGIAFLERRIYTLPPCKSTDCTPTNNQWPPSLNLSMNMSLTDEALREKLINLGDNPGPITNTTRQLYLKRLVSLKNGKHNPSLIQSSPLPKMAHCKYQTKPFLMYGDWVNDLGRYRIIEKNAFKEFSLVSPSRKWREGMNKTCFNYLLLDPRLTRDLPSHVENLSKSTIWNMFLSAIFYIGKGTRNRPYSHLKDAFDAWVSHRSSDSTKIQHILSIWNEGYGVVCLHVFQNSIPVEAYTREAALIDALGLQTLRNCKSGDYYGIAATWNIEEKCNFGRYLLHQALQIFLHEGESQIFPQNL